MKAHSILTMLAATALATVPCLSHADDGEGTKFKFTPSGRILFDGGLFLPQNNGFTDGVAIPDARIGGKATYGKWQAKVDVGFAYGKVGLKDIFMQYTFDDTDLLRLGYFVGQFGLQSSTSSSFKPYMEAPITDSFMNATGRNMGLMWVHDTDKYFMGLMAMADASVMTNTTNTLGKISGGALTRQVWRPLTSDGNIVQIGMSAWYQTALHTAEANDNGVMETSKGYFDYTCTFPTRVCKVNMLGADVSNAKGVLKLSPELLLAKGRFGLEGQYYYMNINRDHGYDSYKAWGAYGYARVLLLGDDHYGYSHGDAGLATPNPGTLELVAGYDYTNAVDNNAGVHGGKTNDVSVTFNYYINKYMLCRLRWSYSDVKDSDVSPDRHVNIIQARLQFKF